MVILFFIFSIIICFSGIITYRKANKIEISRYIEQQEIDKKIEQLKQIKDEYNKLCYKKDKLILDIEKEKENFDNLYEKEKNKLSEQISIFQEKISFAADKYLCNLELNYQTAEQEHDKKMKTLIDERSRYEAELEELRASLSAGVQANLREREKEENLQFYKLSVSTIDLEDIIKLNNLKLTLHNPVILSKLIWTQYFQKQATEMCNRILGIKKICGIYKITNTKTQQCYIGQSVNCVSAHEKLFSVVAEGYYLYNS